MWKKLQLLYQIIYIHVLTNIISYTSSMSSSSINSLSLSTMLPCHDNRTFVWIVSPTISFLFQLSKSFSTTCYRLLIWLWIINRCFLTHIINPPEFVSLQRSAILCHLNFEHKKLVLPELQAQMVHMCIWFIQNSNTWICIHHSLSPFQYWLHPTSHFNKITLLPLR